MESQRFVADVEGQAAFGMLVCRTEQQGVAARRVFRLHIGVAFDEFASPLFQHRFCVRVVAINQHIAVVLADGARRVPRSELLKALVQPAVVAVLLCFRQPNKGIFAIDDDLPPAKSLTMK